MLANAPHSSAVHKPPFHRSAGGLNQSNPYDPSTHLLASSTGHLPARGWQWWAPSERARRHIRAVGEWSASRGMSSSLCMQEAVQWGQSLWRKLACPTIKKVGGLTSEEWPHMHAGFAIVKSPTGNSMFGERQKWSLACSVLCLLQHLWVTDFQQYISYIISLSRHFSHFKCWIYVPCF